MMVMRSSGWRVLLVPVGPGVSGLIARGRGSDDRSVAVGA
jgi:hypothetical protein